MYSKTPLHRVYEKLYNEYRLLYSKKEIKNCVVISYFISYMIENAQKYNLQYLKKDYFLELLERNDMQGIEKGCIYEIEENMNLKHYISKVFRNLIMINDFRFMKEAFEGVLSLCRYISSKDFVRFLNSDLDVTEIKEGKMINLLIKEMVGNIKGLKILDNFAGIGETITEISHTEDRLCLQEMDEVKCAMATMLLVINGYQNFEVINTNSIIYENSELFDLIVSIPPLVMDTTQVYQEMNPNVSAKRDSWGSIKLSLKNLAQHGKLITLVNASALASGIKIDKFVRKYLTGEGHIEAVIELPEKMLYGTDAKVAILVIGKQKIRNITLINLADKSKFTVSRELTDETQSALQEVCQVLHERKKSSLAKSVESTELLENYELLPSLYIGKQQEFEVKNLDELVKERKNLTEYLSELEDEFCDILRKIEGGTSI